MKRFTRTHAFDQRPHVVVAGAGPAALETCLALRAFGGTRFRITIVAPDTAFVYRPAGEPDPLASRTLRRLPLGRFVSATGADWVRSEIVAVDDRARRAATSTGEELPYDVLVVAVGARIEHAVPGAVAVGDPAHLGRLRLLMAAARRGVASSIAFVAPPAPSWRLDLYELAIEAALAARGNRPAHALAVITCEDAPLELLGARAAGGLSHTLAAHGVRVRRGTYVRAWHDGRLVLAPGGAELAADHVAAAVRLRGPVLDGLPWDRDGFLPTDGFGRVQDTPGVFAAGDCTAFPVKHASLAAQQADTAAGSIAAAHGMAIDPVPFTPVLQCMIPARLRWYAEAPITGGHGDATRLSPSPPWPPSARFGSRFLSSFLAGDALARRVPTPAPLDEVRSALRRLERTGS